MGKRQFTRVDFKIIASVTSGNLTAQGEVGNISLHGIYIKDVFVPTGNPAEITMKLSALEPELIITIEASAVREAADGTAFEFTRVDVDSFIHLRKIVSYAANDGDSIMGEFATYVDHKIHESDEHPPK